MTRYEAAPHKAIGGARSQLPVINWSVVMLLSPIVAGLAEIIGRDKAELTEQLASKFSQRRLL